MNQNKEFIEIDKDTEEEDASEGGIYPYDPAYNDIEIGEIPFSVYEYLRQLDKGRINIQPDFQRNVVWNDDQKSQFIESIILNFPLPPIYLNETRESTFIVIDGLQRTTALRDFFQGKYALRSLRALPKYNNLFYKDIPETIQSKFENKKLTVFILKPSTPTVVIYDLFNRINTGGTQLNRQEVRNCIFIGQSTQLLKELAAADYFKRAIDWGVKSTRMKDREVILRYIAFRWFNFEEKYTGDMSNYVETAMKVINGIDIKVIEEIKIDFERVMIWTFRIWGKQNFRIPTEYTRGTINTAIFESISKYVSTKDDNFLLKNEKMLRENYEKLVKNSIYWDSVTKSTGNKIKVLNRFKLVHEILDQNTL